MSTTRIAASPGRKGAAPGGPLAAPPSRAILIIDDSEAVRAQVRSVLEGQGLFSHYLEASDALEGFKILRTRAAEIDLVLCDVVMPRMDGFKFLGLKLGEKRLPHIPVLMLSGLGDVKDKTKGLDQGASDYITKPFDPAELIARVHVHVENKRMRDRLTELSITDGLTGVHNRRHLMEVFEREFDRALRHHRRLSFLMVDIDHFKQFNDRYGHQAGDQVLMKTAEVLRGNLRSHDVLGRYGGEEFALILPETDLDGAQTVADRDRQGVEAQTFGPGRKEMRVTVSIGLATYPMKEVERMEDLLRKADAALYRAKQLGRNRVEIS